MSNHKLHILLILLFTFLQVCLSSTKTDYTVDTTDKLVTNPERGKVSVVAQHYPVIDINPLPENFTAYWVVFYIPGDYPLPSEVLTWLNDTLNRVEAVSPGRKLLLRFAYSEEPSLTNPFTDPLNLTVSIAQLRQMAPILRERIYLIAGAQAGFIGTYGEWYNSPLVPSPQQDLTLHRQLLSVWLNEVLTPEHKLLLPGGVSHYQLVFSNEVHYDYDLQPINTPFGTTDSQRVGLHLDCFLSKNFNKEYFPNSNDEAVGLATTRHIPLLIEVCESPDLLGRFAECRDAKTRMEQFHAAVSSGYYNPTTWNYWKTSDPDCFDEIERRLGYRLVLKSVSFPDVVISNESFNFSIKIENVGFSTLGFNKQLSLVLMAESGGERCEINIDQSLPGAKTMTWYGGSEVQIEGISTVPSSCTVGKQHRVYFKISDSIAPQIARFNIKLANVNIWSSTLYANDLGISLTVGDGQQSSSTYPLVKPDVQFVFDPPSSSITSNSCVKVSMTTSYISVGENEELEICHTPSSTCSRYRLGWDRTVSFQVNSVGSYTLNFTSSFPFSKSITFNVGPASSSSSSSSVVDLKFGLNRDYLIDISESFSVLWISSKEMFQPMSGDQVVLKNYFTNQTLQSFMINPSSWTIKNDICGGVYGNMTVDWIDLYVDQVGSYTLEYVSSDNKVIDRHLIQVSTKITVNTNTTNTLFRYVGFTVETNPMERSQFSTVDLYDPYRQSVHSTSVGVKTNYSAVVNWQDLLIQNIYLAKINEGHYSFDFLGSSFGYSFKIYSKSNLNLYYPSVRLSVSPFGYSEINQTVTITVLTTSSYYDDPSTNKVQIISKYDSSVFAEYPAFDQQKIDITFHSPGEYFFNVIGKSSALSSVTDEQLFTLSHKVTSTLVITNQGPIILMNTPIMFTLYGYSKELAPYSFVSVTISTSCDTLNLVNSNVFGATVTGDVVSGVISWTDIESNIGLVAGTYTLKYTSQVDGVYAVRATTEFTVVNPEVILQAEPSHPKLGESLEVQVSFGNYTYCSGDKLVLTTTAGAKVEKPIASSDVGTRVTLNIPTDKVTNLILTYVNCDGSTVKASRSISMKSTLYATRSPAWKGEYAYSLTLKANSQDMAPFDYLSFTNSAGVSAGVIYVHSSTVNNLVTDFEIIISSWSLFTAGTYTARYISGDSEKAQTTFQVVIPPIAVLVNGAGSLKAKSTFNISVIEYVQPAITTFQFTTSPVLDGVLTEWSAVPVLESNAQMGYDAEQLYVAFTSTSTKLVFLNTDGDDSNGYYGNDLLIEGLAFYKYNPTTTPNDYSWTSIGAVNGVNVLDAGSPIHEIGIPRSSLIGFTGVLTLAFGDVSKVNTFSLPVLVVPPPATNHFTFTTPPTLDGDLSEWSEVPSFPSGAKLGQDDTTIYASFGLNTNTMFVEVDGSSSTGYYGFDILIESNSLYTYLQTASPNLWSWSYAGPVSGLNSGLQHELSFPRSYLQPARTQFDFVIGTDLSSTYTYYLIGQLAVSTAAPAAAPTVCCGSGTVLVIKSTTTSEVVYSTPAALGQTISLAINQPDDYIAEFQRSSGEVVSSGSFVIPTTLIWEGPTSITSDSPIVSPKIELLTHPKDSSYGDNLWMYKECSSDPFLKKILNKKLEISNSHLIEDQIFLKDSGKYTFDYYSLTGGWTKKFSTSINLLITQSNSSTPSPTGSPVCVFPPANYAGRYKLEDFLC